MKTTMKNSIYTLLAFAAIIMLPGCTKSTPIDGDEAQAEKGLKFLVNCGAETKDTSGESYFPDAENSGALYFKEGDIYIISIPVAEDGTLEYEKYKSHGYSYIQDNYLYEGGLCTDSYRSSDWWFENSTTGKCIFVAALNGGDGSDRFTTYTYIQGIGQNRWLLYPFEWNTGVTSYMPKIEVPDYQYSRRDYQYINGKRKLVEYRADHIAACTSGIISKDEADAQLVVGLTKFKPISSVLYFDIKLDSETEQSVLVNNIRISYEGTERQVWGFNALFNFDNVLEETNWYKVIDIPYINAVTGQDLYEFKYLYNDNNDDDPDNDSYNNLFYKYSGESNRIYLSIDNDRDDYNQNGFVVTTTPSERHFTAAVIPQYGFPLAGEEDAYVVFKLCSRSGEVLRTVRKKFPANGFQSGKRYDFTLTVPEGNDSGYVDAGGYNMVDWE